LERRRPGPPRTPFSGLQDGVTDDDLTDSDCVQAPKSRFYSDFDVIGELGEGSFGKVYKVLSRLDGCMYAIKAAHRQAKGASDRDRMLKEVRFVERQLFSFCFGTQFFFDYNRYMHWRRYQILPTQLIFTSYAFTKLGWKMIDYSYKLNFVWEL
jgi:serine/threonine protein kinase